jgi:dihydrofolate reductase
MISIICLLDQRSCLADQTTTLKRVPWYPALFNEQVRNTTTIMSNSTWKVLLNKKQLPGCHTVVVARDLFDQGELEDHSTERDGIVFCSNFKTALSVAQSMRSEPDNKLPDISLLGDGDLLTTAVVQSVVDFVILVRTKGKDFPGKTFFSVDLNDYFKRGIRSEAFWKKDKKTSFSKIFEVWCRK